MAVPNDYVVETAVGSGATIQVDIDWDFENSTELDVWVQRTSDGEIKRASLAEITFTVASDKSYATVENPWEPEASNKEATAFVARETPKTQTYQPVESEALNPASLEAALDKAVKMIQETASNTAIVDIGGNLQFQYSADASDWHTNFQAGDQYWRTRYGDNGSWSPAVSLVSVTDQVGGPATSTDNAIARFDGETGQLIKNSVVKIGATGFDFGQLAVFGGLAKTREVTAATDDLVLTDIGKTIDLNRGTAILVTIPTNAAVAFPIGTEILFAWIGAGTPAIKGDTGVSLNGTAGGVAPMLNQYGACAIRKISVDAWIIFGDNGAVS